MLDDFKLRVFATVADCGSFTLAAKKLNISQPAVSQNISELERLISAPLFLRNRGSVELTDKGALFLKYALKVLRQYDRINAIFVSKTEAPEEPMLLNLSESRQAEVSVDDGSINIKFT